MDDCSRFQRNSTAIVRKGVGVPEKPKWRYFLNTVCNVADEKCCARCRRSWTGIPKQPCLSTTACNRHPNLLNDVILTHPETTYRIFRWQVSLAARLHSCVMWTSDAQLGRKGRRKKTSPSPTPHSRSRNAFLSYDAKTSFFSGKYHA